MKRFALGAFVLGALMSLCVSAAADDKSPAPAKAQAQAQAQASKSYQMKEQIIVGRPNKPLAAMDVSKLPMKSTLTELKQPFTGRIEATVAQSPF